jgi:glycerol kinase
MEKQYIVALDQGTTSSRAMVFDKQGNKMGMQSKALPQIFPKPGWVEHDALQIWEDQKEVLKAVLKNNGIAPEQIAAIGIANQRETVVVWDKHTGKPVGNAIVWQCRRTASICNELKKNGLEKVIQEKTGLVVDAYFSGSKIKWILDHIDSKRKRASQGELLAGTMDTWLIWNLTGGRVHVTDPSNASRTMLYNIHKNEWDEDLLNMLDIPPNILPAIVPSSGFLGELSVEILGVKVPLCAAIGDQQGALFGQMCTEKGMAKNTYGTGCFILMNTGNTAVFSKQRLLTTIAWDLGKGVVYALEGSVFQAGSSVQWLMEGLGLLENPAKSSELAGMVGDTDGVYLVPAFTGMGAPYWDMYARGLMVGITRGTRKEHVIRAALEAIAYQSRDVFEAMGEDSGIPIKELRVDGGASSNDFLMQFQADVMRVKVNRPKITETTSLGAAYLAGLGVGFWENMEEISKIRESEKVFLPQMSMLLREKKYTLWKKAVQRSLSWEDASY